jgi:hypothetical protein
LTQLVHKPKPTDSEPLKRTRDRVLKDWKVGELELGVKQWQGSRIGQMREAIGMFV